MRPKKAKNSYPVIAFVVALGCLVVFVHRSPGHCFGDAHAAAADASPALRCIVLTGGTRVSSLYRLLRSVSDLVSEGDRIDVDVWIDLPPGPSVPQSVLEHRARLAEDIRRLGTNGTYKLGAIRAHVWPRNAGLHGQWLDAWHKSIPGGLQDDTKEVGLILEDDLEVSPYAWRWLKAAHAAYGAQERVAGFSLQRLQLCAARCKDLQGGPDLSGGGFLYPIVGTWGYSPTARHFARFRRWYYSLPAGYKPYVEGISPTDWYRSFEAQKTARKRMWSMHHIRYTHTHVDRYTVYAKPRDGTSLSVNHREPGANYQKKDKPTHDMLVAWDPELVRFSDDPLVLNYKGQIIKGTRQVPVPNGPAPAAAAVGAGGGGGSGGGGGGGGRGVAAQV